MRESPVLRDTARDREHEEILRHIDRWLDESLISKEEAEAIRRYEMQHAVAPVRHVSLIGEAVAYVGAALALAAGLMFLGGRFEDLSRTERILTPSIAAIVFLAAGWALRRNHTAPTERLAGALWLLATAAICGTSVEIVFDVQDPPGWGLLTVAVITAVVGFALMWSLPTAATHIGAATGTAAILPGVIVWIDPDHPNVWVGLSLVAFGWLWLMLGRWEAVKPPLAAYVIGTIAALYGSASAAGGDFTGEALLIGCAVATSLLVGGVWLKNTAVLVLAAIGAFGFAFASILWFLEDDLGAPLALLLGGVALLVVAWIAVRLGAITRRPQERAGTTSSE